MLMNHPESPRNSRVSPRNVDMMAEMMMTSATMPSKKDRLEKSMLSMAGTEFRFQRKCDLIAAAYHHCACPNKSISSDRLVTCVAASAAGIWPFLRGRGA